jgi:hypothetical protein
MRNKLVPLSYLALFFGLVSVYDIYQDYVYLVALVTELLTFSGLAAWLWSAQTGTNKHQLKKSSIGVSSEWRGKNAKN